MTKRRVYGEISLEDYQAVLDEVERRKRTTQDNGTEREIPDRPSVWSRLKKTPKWVVIGLLVVLCYSMGATWRWGGRAARALSMEELVTVASDSTYTDDQARQALLLINRKVRAGLEALAVLADNREGEVGSFALEELRLRSAQSQELLRSR